MLIHKFSQSLGNVKALVKMVLPNIGHCCGQLLDSAQSILNTLLNNILTRQKINNHKPPMNQGTKP
jgi:bacterioferritin-associated ferredoxin